ncbi:MAG: pyridoxal phosphate-dependent decarboxylase family protein [Bacteroidia bacterium]
MLSSLMYWPKLDDHKMKLKVFEALSANANYRSENILGIPGTFLDPDLFYDIPFLKDAPFLSSLIANPNHIGCHTLNGEHESLFSGTQKIEKDLIRICAEELFKAEPGRYDGYVASGGTEANIEALWMYRNYYFRERDAMGSEIAVICSSDTHYSVYKACNLLRLDSIVVNVDGKDRVPDIHDMEHQVSRALRTGKKYFILVLNMGTTMFGSVDPIEKVSSFFNLLELDYKLHVDAAHGGFMYSMTNPGNPIHFMNPSVSSVSLDAHKMLQAPYGTGIFLARKGLIAYAKTPEATYVKGTDYTLCGSRSGANAVCVWMLLHTHGSAGWIKKMRELSEKSAQFCDALTRIGIGHFRNPYMNIVALKADQVPAALAERYYLVPDTYHGEPNWYKVVIMPHVSQHILDNFLTDLLAATTASS